MELTSFWSSSLASPMLAGAHRNKNDSDTRLIMRCSCRFFIDCFRFMSRIGVRPYPSFTARLLSSLRKLTTSAVRYLTSPTRREHLLTQGLSALPTSHNTTEGNSPNGALKLILLLLRHVDEHVLRVASGLHLDRGGGGAGGPSAQRREEVIEEGVDTDGHHGLVLVEPFNVVHRSLGNTAQSEGPLTASQGSSGCRGTGDDRDGSARRSTRDPLCGTRLTAS